MKTEIPVADFGHAWTHYASDYYYYSPSKGASTHIHMGGGTHGGIFTIHYISLKVDDRFAGKIYDRERIGTNWGCLDDINHQVATEFRKALSALGIY